MEDMILKVILSLITSGALGACAWLGKQVSNYKKLLKEKDDIQIIKIVDEEIDKKLEPIRIDIKSLQNIDSRIDTKIKPVQEELDLVKDDIEVLVQKEEFLQKETLCAWRYRIRALCKQHIAKDYMTQDEYDQLSEMFKLYTAMGGNGQTKELYERTIKLEIVSDKELK